MHTAEPGYALRFRLGRSRRRLLPAAFPEPWLRHAGAKPNRIGRGFRCLDDLTRNRCLQTSNHAGASDRAPQAFATPTRQLEREDLEQRTTLFQTKQSRYALMTSRCSPTPRDAFGTNAIPDSDVWPICALLALLLWPKYRCSSSASRFTVGCRLLMAKTQMFSLRGMAKTVLSVQLTRARGQNAPCVRAGPH